MNLVNTSLYQVDISVNEVTSIDIPTQGDDLENYIVGILQELSKDTNTRKFKFGSNSTEIRTAIDKALNSEFHQASKIAANRLLKIEKKTQDKISHLGVEIQKGSLFLALLEENETKRLIICKADHTPFLDEEDFQEHKGLPLKRKIFKAFATVFDSNNEIDNVLVYDTNTPMSKYWWEEFLELNEIYTSTHNTKQALEALDKGILSKYKNTFQADHTILRNSMIKYFRTHQEFTLSSYLEELTNYTPVDPNLPLKDIQTKVENLPEKYSFDNRFPIAAEEVTKRMTFKIRLNDKMDLILKQDINNLSNIIEPLEEADGTKYIKIKSEEGFKRFQKRT